MPPPPPPPPPPLPPDARDPSHEYAVAEALRRDGTLDALKTATIDALKREPTLKTFTEFAVRSSATLRDEARARSMTRKELVDALFRECESRVLDETRGVVWEALTETREGVGREAYVRAFAASTEIRKRSGRADDGEEDRV